MITKLLLKLSFNTIKMEKNPLYVIENIDYGEKTKEKISDFKDNTLFEISWEVCNKVGGIHTVIVSKAKQVKRVFNENYFLVGPYLNSNNPEFIEKGIPEKFEPVINELQERGIIPHFGKWRINNIEVNTILIDFKNASKNINDIKGKIWENFKIDSLNTNYYDWDEPILFSYCAGIVIEKMNNILNRTILIQAHEWLSGGAILYLKSLENINEREKYKCVFTTHATMLGRSLCGNGMDLYEIENKINPDEKAYELGIQTKHQTEKVLANISDCFTTVSDITAREAKFFYGKKPDVIVYNGFDNSNLKDISKLNQNFFHSREKTDKFLESFFNNFYDVNFDKTQIFFTSGRFEFENKGIDLIIDSASKLNQNLKDKNSDRNIIIFLLIMIGKFRQNQEVINSINNYEKGIKREFETEFAPLSTHEISTENIIIKKLIEKKLLNHIDDKVKVILIPEILNGSENVFNFEYYHFTEGFDLGIFPSYYEPWGYTPLETISYSIPTITSNLSGFGKYIENNLLEENKGYVEIIDREKSNFNDASEKLSEIMFDFTKKNQKELLIQKENSKKFALNFDWNFFIKNYIDAYHLALRKE